MVGTVQKGKSKAEQMKMWKEENKCLFFSRVCRGQLDSALVRDSRPHPHNLGLGGTWWLPQFRLWGAGWWGRSRE